jgi:sigma-B regulation protein RsbU (phosphoserine phosphatase)
MCRPRKLQQRLSVFLLLPVAILLFSVGVIGFVYIRQHLLTQWQEAAILRLQRAAHNVDMRLATPQSFMKILNKNIARLQNDRYRKDMVDQIKELEGVSDASFVFYKRSDDRILRELNTQDFRMSPPRYEPAIDHLSVSLVSYLSDKSDQALAKFSITLEFNYIIEDIMTTGWWESDKAFLVDQSGKILSCTISEKRSTLHDSASPIELQTLAAMQKQPFGTILGQGHPPAEVSGFYRLNEAPWFVIVVAPGEKILKPIVTFRFYYFIIGGLLIAFILILIKEVTGQTVASIKKVSDAAVKITQGDFENPLPVKSQDEVGDLTQSFNAMMSQLKERLQLKESMGLAKEVQQNLLPKKEFNNASLDIAGDSLYCDETGGDYYDIFQYPLLENGKIGIAVGDVVGHGISAAMLMTTVRALLRCRVASGGCLSKIMSDVNKLLCLDNSNSYAFVTLFGAIIDTEDQMIEWVRAGHEPAFIYDPDGDSFAELRGEGLPLGVNDDYGYQQNAMLRWKTDQILIIGTDGLWEAENPEGEMFGKKRFRRLIRENSHLPADTIIAKVYKAINVFRNRAVQNDDMTLVIVKQRN